jgi:hypothetical protein
VAQRNALDPASRRTLVGFALRASGLSGGVAVLAAVGVLPAHGLLGLLEALCAISAMFSAARAARHGAMFARGGLNAWDEAVAFWGGLLALHAAQRFLG